MSAVPLALSSPSLKMTMRRWCASTSIVIARLSAARISVPSPANPSSAVSGGCADFERSSSKTSGSVAKPMSPNLSVGFNFAMAAFIRENASARCSLATLSDVSSKKTTDRRCSLCVLCKFAKASTAQKRAPALRQSVTHRRHLAEVTFVPRRTSINKGTAASKIKKRGWVTLNILFFTILFAR